MRNLLLICLLLITTSGYSQTLYIFPAGMIDASGNWHLEYYFADKATTSANITALQNFDNSQKVINTNQAATNASLQAQISAGGGGTSGGGYMARNIPDATYTITTADNGYTLFFTRSTGCTVIAPVLTKVIEVKLVRNGGALGVTPNSNVTLKSINNYRRISSNCGATISYNNLNTATLDGKLTY